MSAFCSGLCNEMSRCCYDFFHAPFTKKNLLIGGGILLGLIIFIIIMVVAFGSSSQKPTTAEDLLKRYPLVDGANSLSKNLKVHYMNQLNLIKNGLFTNFAINCSYCQTDFYRLSHGHVATQVFSVTSNCDAQYRDAVSETLEQIDLIKRIILTSKQKLALVNEATDIAKYFSEGKTGVIINVWGGHNIDSRLSVLRMFYDLGVRIMSLVSSDPNTSTLACTPPWISQDGSLTPFGKDVIGEMNRLGMVIDLTGSTTKTQESVMDVSKAPVFFSHSASFTLVNNKLNVDDTILGKKDKIALVMVPFTPSQLSKDSKSEIATVAEHLDLFNKILSDTSKLGIGSNFDNMTSTTKGLEDVSKFVNLIEYLKNRSTNNTQIGWSDSSLEGLISHNFIKAFKNIQKLRNITSLAADNLIPDTLLPATVKNQNETCYSDLIIRYNNSLPTEAPPTTTNATTQKPPKTEPTKKS